MGLFKYGPFPLGADTTSPEFDLPTDERARSRVQVAVRKAVNVDLTARGHFKRRVGFEMVQAFSGGHSLFSDGLRTVFVRAGVLYRITSFEPYAEALVKLLSSDAPMSYVAIRGELWCSNGTDFGRLGAAHAWQAHALPTPAAPTLTAGAGALPVGRYQVALRYARADGEEGGVAEAYITLAEPGSIIATLPDAVAGAAHINVYASALNGGVPQFHSQVAAGAPSVTISANPTGRAVQGLNLQPLPAGRLAYFNGRMLSYSGSRLHYSAPFNLGLHDPVAGWIEFPSDVSVAVPAQDGVYVASDVTRWLAGSDMAAVSTMSDVLPYGAAAGTEFSLPDSAQVGWYGDEGLVVAGPGGQVKAAQELYAAPSAASGAVLVTEAAGTTDVVVSLTDTTPSPRSQV